MKSGIFDLSKFSEKELERKVFNLTEGGDYEEGISLGREALQKFPTSETLWNNVGCCFFNLRRDYEAIVCDKRDIQFSQNGREKSRALNGYCVTWRNLGILSLAEEYSRKSVKEDPTYYFGLGNLGKLLIRLGKLEESKSIAKELESRSLSSREKSNYYELKGGLALIEGRNEEAENFYNSAKQLTHSQYERDSVGRSIEDFKEWAKKEKIRKQYFSLRGLSHGERMKKVEELWGNVKTQNEINFFDSINFKEIKLGSKIGEGSFGIVYAGEWKSVKVAVKIIDIEKFENPQYILSEIALISSFNHKHVIPLIGSGLNGKDTGNRITQELFLIMPFMKGSLKSILFSLSLKRILRTCFDICCGMEYLHQIGIIHRDLKPDNCLIDNEDHIVICDFEFSRIENGTKLKTYTRTLEYMAPEILLDSQDKRIECGEVVDVYSFGVILWEMLSKKKAQSFDPMKKSVLGESTTLHLEECDKRFHSILKKTLIEDPMKRSKFRDILELLVDILDEIGFG